MKLRVAVPMNHYLKFEIMFNTSKFNLNSEYVRVYKLLQAEVVTIYDPFIEKALYRIIHRIKTSFSMPVTYRLWIDNNAYIEEIVTKENIDIIPNPDLDETNKK